MRLGKKILSPKESADVLKELSRNTYDLDFEEPIKLKLLKSAASSNNLMKVKKELKRS